MLGIQHPEHAHFRHCEVPNTVSRCTPDCVSYRSLFIPTYLPVLPVYSHSKKDNAVGSNSEPDYEYFMDFLIYNLIGYWGTSLGW